MSSWFGSRSNDMVKNSNDPKQGFALTSYIPNLSTSTLCPSTDNIRYTHVRDDSAQYSYPHQPPPSLGKPTVKKAVSLIDAVAITFSLLSLAAAIAVVASDTLAWHLSENNYQLIAVGFLLSVMTICLTSISPALFLLLEARFGPSTLQNYEGILRGQLLTSNLSFLWRLTFAIMILLPIGLSVAYKTFTGGHSVMHVRNPADYTGNQSYYGLYPPPGLQSPGRNSGLSIFSNATLSFLLSTSPTNGTEPPLADFPKAYGFNSMVLDNHTAAILDTPQDSYVSAVQRLLLPGESWVMEASVYGTVATYDTSNHTNSTRYESDFIKLCETAQASSGAYTRLQMFNGWNFILVDNPSPGNQTVQYVGFTPVSQASQQDSCSTIAPYMHRFSVTRQQCKGTWSIEPGIVQLTKGDCDGGLLPPEKQLVIANNDLFLGFWYLPSLAELLGSFATSRNQSDWLVPSLATGVAAMLWSRITALDGPTHPVQDSFWASQNYTQESVGMVYTVKEDVVEYIRPTMRKSPWLFVVLAIEPVVSMVMVLAKWLLRSTPIDEGFGLKSILAGLNTENLESLRGASLSGELSEKVRMVIMPKKTETRMEMAIGIGNENVLEYRIALGNISVRNGRLDRREVYH